MKLALRMRHRFIFKTAGITLFIWIFFIGYFYVLRHPSYPVTIMPLTALDRMIPFQPQALFPYLSLWFYLGIAPSLMPSIQDLLIYGMWAAALCLTGLFCFYVWPTTVPPLEIDVSGHTGFAMLQGADATGNACPSLHVATAMFTAIWIERMLLLLRMPWIPRLLNALWFAAIVYSTVATKQHVVIDVLAGAVLGIVFALVSLRWRPRNANGAAF